MGGGSYAEGQYFRVSSGLVGTAEGFDARLQELARGRAAVAKYRPQIAKSRWLRSRRGGEVISRERSRNGSAGCRIAGDARA